MHTDDAYMQMARVDGYNPQTGKKDTPFAWTDVYEKSSGPFLILFHLKI